MTSLDFEVSTDKAPHIALTMNPSQTNIHEYVIGLGRDGNKRTIIDRLNVRKMEKPLFSDSVGRISGPHVYDRFWLNFDSGNFSVGRYGNPEPFFNWLDPNPLEFRSIGLMTWWGSTGRWKFHSFC
ncbi:uncharacterized protein [Diadema antillarum]|uniref:uncharacterized protein n=1 Tax=Diadema antillarum TaxID=105358 RepID=UPI003A8B7198